MTFEKDLFFFLAIPLIDDQKKDKQRKQKAQMKKR